jgi:lipoprotein-anchoring transpeptidase ErfK/SrfK
MKATAISSCLLASVLAATSGQAASGTQASANKSLDAATVNDGGLVDSVARGDRGAAVLRAQILLERARFSPGEIDAAYGSNLRQAIAGFQTSRGLHVSGDMDLPTWQALDADTAPALINVTLSAEDVAGPFTRLPQGLPARSKLDALGYESAAEALGEKFHASPALLKQLNPGKDFTRAGETLVVPSVQPSWPMPAIAKVVVDKSDHTVSLQGEDGKLVAQYPASTGSEHDPLPVGKWKIEGVARHPTFHYNPKLFWDAESTDVKATLAAGPNNPVGVVWIDLSKPHYGIHGTPEPSKIGKTESHGCIRMTNWSALTVSQAVKPGMAVTLQP